VRTSSPSGDTPCHAATGLLSTSAAHLTPTYFAYPGSAPSISADAASDAILWVLQTDTFEQGSAILHASDASDAAMRAQNSTTLTRRDRVTTPEGP
jgi:hypothetical protein